ncbi:hypothetical protein BHU61_06695 [Macrococcus epidermidis]|uniref:Uncharacterized protein n=1 Tax=Macrococcus epidermidis TaxID=1902580 RepID=A0A327ZSH4_9STAP|nr:hypothetical protein [Macrococcus epidermidis]RAK44996.1 hypothetical protein BHU61_06695 [Macrococcus epidermidis]
MNVFKDLNNIVMKERQDYSNQIQRNINDAEELFNRVHPIFEEMKEALSVNKEIVDIKEERHENYLIKFLNSKVLSIVPGGVDGEEVIALRVNISDRLVDIYTITQLNGKDDSLFKPLSLDAIKVIKDEDLKEHFEDVYLNFARMVL